MRGVALRCMGDFQGAAESYQAAVDVCQEYEDVPNWAVAQANQGMSLEDIVGYLASFPSFRLFVWSSLRRASVSESGSQNTGTEAPG